jgi:phosphoribosylaminoimidazolecarboxamide formyltransferase/IMP cyclohydrolase
LSLPVRRALLSVSDKSGVIELANALAARGIEIVSTGGTARLLAGAGIAVREVSSYTGFPEIMDGRVKTLHPKIHGGLLGRRGVDDAVMAQHGIAPIDLLVVNLYPFAATVSRSDCTYEEAIENIDIGGPAMLRAAAKNHAAVLVVVDPRDYPALLQELDTHQGGSEFATRARFAAKAFAHTAAYDSMVAGYLSAQPGEGRETLADPLTLVFNKVQDLRYGENPHQIAAFYRDPLSRGAGIAGARVLQGKDLSFNNIADADTAIECVRQFTTPAMRHRQARQPVRRRPRHRPARRLRGRVPHRPNLGVWRHHRLQLRSGCSHRGHDHRATVRRGACRPRGARRRRTHPGRQAERACAGARGARTRRWYVARVAQRQRGSAGADT